MTTTDASRSALAFGPMDRRRDLREVNEILAWCFGLAGDDLTSWLEEAQISNVRVVREAGRVVAALIVIPMGQYFGGRAVPMVGIAGVGVHPTLRDRGLALEMMRRTIVEQAREGFAVSTLYPSTQTLYRAAGYSVAGARYETTLPMARLASQERGIAIRPFSPTDLPELARVRSVQAARTPGELERGPYVWQRIHSPRGMVARGFIAEENGEIEGYCFMTQKTREDGYYDLALRDFTMLTRRAGASLLAFLRDQRTLVPNVTWSGSLAHPALALLSEKGYELKVRQPWMLRVLDVKQALEKRGYGRGIDAALELAIEDDLLARNAGRFSLRVANGRGKVTRGGRGPALHMDVRALGQLYTGHLPASTLAAIGELDGRAKDTAIADTLFAGGAPHISDHF